MSRRRRLTNLATAIAAVAITPLCLPVSRAAASSCPLTSMSASSQGACWEPFTATSPFNTPLPASPQLASDSAAVSQHMAQYGWSLGGSDSGYNLQLDGTRPVYFATASDPVMTIDCTSEEGPGTCTGTNGVDINGMQIHVPAGAQPTSNGDAHMTVIESATGQEFDFWHTSVSGSVITAGTGAQTSTATGDGTGGGGDAAGFALAAGLLRPSELLSGQINHALVVDVPCTNATGANVGYTYPAAGGWGEFCGEYWNEQASNAPELGQRFFLNMSDAQIAASGAPSWEQTIMTALAHYGAYIEDTNGSWHDDGMYIFTQDPTSWTSLGQTNQWASVAAAFGQSGSSTLSSSVPIPVSKLELVDTCVTLGTCVSSAGSTSGSTTSGATTSTTTVSSPPAASTTSTTSATSTTPAASTLTPSTTPTTPAAATATTGSAGDPATSTVNAGRRHRGNRERLTRRRLAAARHRVRTRASGRARGSRRGH